MFERQDKLQEHLPRTTVCPKIQNGALVGRVVLPEKRDIGVKIAHSSQRPSNYLLDKRWKTIQSGDSWGFLHLRTTPSAL